MSYRVFARKYRPQRFEEIVGQEHIVKTLQNAIRQNRLAQAYLFVGPRGTGKTSTARVLAKALNCAKGPSPDPCGVCSNCIEIAEGRNMDVLEIDGASNNSVENIRDLRENVMYAPVNAPFKIYYVDEVHMLSAGAFNALLKTLEEPPAHVKFIFATTEAHKLPATITSRCQRFDLRRISVPAIAKHLKAIAIQEAIELDDKAADLIARGADGGLRDAESMLDQAVAFCGERIGEEDVLDVFGFTSRDVVRQLVEHVLRCKAGDALELVTSQAESGKDLGRLLNDLVGWLRDVLMFQVAGRNLSEEREVQDHAALVQREKLLELLNHFSDTEGRIRWASDKRIALEVAVIKGVHILEQANLSEVLDVLSSFLGSRTEDRGPKVEDLKPRAEKENRQPEVSDQKNESRGTRNEERVQVIEQPEPKAEESGQRTTDGGDQIPDSNTCPTSPLGPAPTSFDGSWSSACSKLAGKARLKYGWLETGRFLRVDGAKVIVEFPESQRVNSESIFWAELQKDLDRELSEQMGRKVTLGCEFYDDALEIASESTTEPTFQPEAPVSKSISHSISEGDIKIPPKVESAESKESVMERFKNDPLIRKALEIFKAEIV